MPDETTTETKPETAADTKPAGDTGAAADTTAATTTTTDAAAKPAGDTTSAAEKTTPAGTEGTAAAAPEAFDASALTLPDGSPLTEVMREGIAGEAKALGLTTAQAQQLLTARDAAVRTFATQLLTDLRADPELGGTHLETTLEHARRGRDFLFPPGSEAAVLLREYFDATGLGNHKALVREFARIGKARREDRPASGGARPSTVERKPTAEVMFPNAAQ